MPNYVSIKIQFLGKPENVKTVLDLIKSEENGCIDFEKIIPMPDNIFRGNIGAEEQKKYGKNNWYDWSIENWGTKWNACDPDYYRGSDTITFMTAWSLPMPIIEKLVDICKENEILFDGEFAEESGEFSGRFYLIDDDGDIEFNIEPDETQEEMYERMDRLF